MSLIESLNAMNPNGQVTDGTRCAVWKCNSPVVSASHCRNHQYLDNNNEVAQGGLIPPTADQDCPPKVVKRTAKRTPGFVIKRNTAVKPKPAQEATDSNTPSLDTVSFEERNKAWLTKVRKKPHPSGEFRESEAPSQSQPGPPLDSSTANASPPRNHKSITPGTAENPQPKPTKNPSKSPAASAKSPIAAASGNEGSSAEHGDWTAMASQNEIARGAFSKPQLGFPLGQNLPPSVSTVVQTAEMEDLSDKAEEHQVAQKDKDASAVAKSPDDKGLVLEESHNTNDPLNGMKKRKLAALEDSLSPLQPSDKLHGVQQGLSRTDTQRSSTCSHHRPKLPAAHPGAFVIDTGNLRGLEKPQAVVMRPPKRPKIPSTKPINGIEQRHASEPVVPLMLPSITLVRRATMSPTWQAPRFQAETNSKDLVESSSQHLRTGSRDFSRERSPLAFLGTGSNQRPLSHLMELDEDSSTSIENDSTAREVTSPPTSLEERRNSKVMEHQPAAFDTMIYRHSSMSLPQGAEILASAEHPEPSPTHENDRRYLLVDPAIHKPHNRSDEWHREKAQEIRARCGRKSWFGKVGERQHWLRTTEEEREEKILDAFAQGRRLPPADPQPWTHKRILDFGDIPEDELPQDVLGNPAWLKACGWFREINAQRHKEVDEKRIIEQRAIFSLTQEVRKQFIRVSEDSQRKRSRAATETDPQKSTATS